VTNDVSTIASEGFEKKKGGRRSVLPVISTAWSK